MRLNILSSVRARFAPKASQPLPEPANPIPAPQLLISSEVKGIVPLVRLRHGKDLPATDQDYLSVNDFHEVTIENDNRQPEYPAPTEPRVIRISVTGMRPTKSFIIGLCMRDDTITLPYGAHLTGVKIAEAEHDGILREGQMGRLPPPHTYLGLHVQYTDAAGNPQHYIKSLAARQSATRTAEWKEAMSIHYA